MPGWNSMGKAVSLEGFFPTGSKCDGPIASVTVTARGPQIWGRRAERERTKLRKQSSYEHRLWKQAATL